MSRSGSELLGGSRSIIIHDGIQSATPCFQRRGRSGMPGAGAIPRGWHRAARGSTPGAAGDPAAPARRAPPPWGLGSREPATAVVLQQSRDAGKADEEPTSDLVKVSLSSLDRVEDALSEILRIDGHGAPPRMPSFLEEAASGWLDRVHAVAFRAKPVRSNTYSNSLFVWILAVCRIIDFLGASKGLRSAGPAF